MARLLWWIELKQSDQDFARLLLHLKEAIVGQSINLSALQGVHDPNDINGAVANAASTEDTNSVNLPPI